MKTKLLEKILKYSLLTAVLAGVAICGGCEGSDDPGASDLDSYFANHPSVSDPARIPTIQSKSARQPK